jgi:LacI family transcriptional regulator
MTIKDISALTGYSVGTVSRVLNNQPNVSEKARKAVMAVVEVQGFELNTNAKNLKQSQGRLVCHIIKSGFLDGFRIFCVFVIPVVYVIPSD